MMGVLGRGGVAMSDAALYYMSAIEPATHIRQHDFPPYA